MNVKMYKAFEKRYDSLNFKGGNFHEVRTVLCILDR
jgi:hypothetical protein